jgi:hypothetical protein
MQLKRLRTLIGVLAGFASGTLAACDRVITEPEPGPLPATVAPTLDIGPAAEELPLFEEIEPYLEMVSIEVGADGKFEPGKYLAIGYYKSNWNNRHELTTQAFLLRNGTTVGTSQPQVKTASGFVGAIARIMRDTVTLATPQPCLLAGRTEVSGKAFFWYQIPTVPPVVGTTPPRPATAAKTIDQSACPALEFDQAEDPLVLYLGQQKPLTANCYGEPQTWWSENINIAAVANGVVTGTNDDYGIYTPPLTTIIHLACRGENIAKGVLVRYYDPDPEYDHGDDWCDPYPDEDPSDDCPEDYEPPCTECQQWLNWDCYWGPFTGFRCDTWEEWDCYDVDPNLCESAANEEDLAIDRPRSYITLASAAQSSGLVEVP